MRRNIKKELNTYDELESKGKEKEKLVKERKARRLNENLVAGMEDPAVYIEWFQKEDIYIYIYVGVYMCCVYICGVCDIYTIYTLYIHYIYTLYILYIYSA